MIRNPLKHSRFLILALACFLIMAGTLTGIGQSRRRPAPRQTIDSDFPEPTEPASAMPHKQKQELLKSKLEDMRRDAAEMTKLASSIQEDLEKTTENELPLRVVNKAEQVEKLAKRIKNTARGY